MIFKPPSLHPWHPTMRISIEPWWELTLCPCTPLIQMPALCYSWRLRTPEWHTPCNCIQFLVDVWSFKASCWTEIDALYFHPVSNQSLLSPGQKCNCKTRLLPWYIHDQATTICAQIKVAFYFLEVNHWYKHSPLHFHCRCCKQNGGEFLDESKLNLNILGLQFTEKKKSDEGSR